jgi:molecular chaperone DnaJ
MKDVRAGDLIVNVNVVPHIKFRREYNNIVIDKTVSAWDAILGSSTDIDTLDGKKLTINIPAGTQPNTVLSCRGEGLPIMRSRNRGNLLINIIIEIPKNLSQTTKDLIKQIKDN